MKRVYVTRNLADVYLVKDYFAAEGLQFEIRGEHLVGTQGGLPLTADTLPSLWVADEDVERAVQLLHDRPTEPVTAGEIDDRPPGDIAEGGVELLSQLFLLTGRLKSDPRRGDLLDKARALADALDAADRPFGIEAPTWEQMTGLARSLTHSAAQNDHEAVQERATELRELLGSYV